MDAVLNLVAQAQPLNIGGIESLLIALVGVVLIIAVLAALAQGLGGKARKVMLIVVGVVGALVLLGMATVPGMAVNVGEAFARTIFGG